MKTKLTLNELVLLIDHVCTEMIGAKDRLTELDAEIGDGDLGVTVSLGFSAVRNAIHAKEYANLQELLSGCGTAFADNAASTFGTLMYTMFSRAGRAVKNKTEVSTTDAADMLRAATEGVMLRGKANLGDKTMLDALIPGSQALDEAVGEGLSLPKCMMAALEAAKEGAQNTINLKAKAGRSEWMGDRTIGVKDAGAEAIVILLTAATDFINNNKE
jgi:dihydroxyacetone kinase phosphoprotein-dependent L subunit